MKNVSGRDLCRALERKGWRLNRTSGSHRIYVKTKDDPSLSVPVHGAKDLSPGVQRMLMKQAGLTDADL